MKEEFELKGKNEYEFYVTFAKYDGDKFVDSKSIFVTVNTNFKRQTSMKYAIAKAIVEVNKNTEKGRKNKWKYYSII